MKGSAVVQGLKSLAAKIHPQRPLTRRESDQLLTALTSSFRHHLDQVHPQGAKGEQRKHADLATVCTSSVDASGSSALFTDKHLASILTSPLLTNNTHYTSAKAKLKHEFAGNPIGLLEDYDSKGIATLQIAELCLETVKQSPSLSAAATNDPESQAGRKVFNWLKENNLFESLVAQERAPMMSLMTYFLLREQRDDLLWQWLKLDIKSPIAKPGLSSTSPIGENFDRYRWRGRLLLSIVRTQLDSLDKGSVLSRAALNDALDTFLLACEIKKSTKPGDHLYWLPLGLAGFHLHARLTNPLLPLSAIDEHRYDKFMDVLPVRMEGASQAQIDVRRAELQLCHPVNASADLAYHVLQDLLSPNPSPSMKKLLLRVHAGKHYTESNGVNLLFARTACILQEQGHTSEATWVLSKIQNEFPHQARTIVDYMQGIARQRSLRNSSPGSESNTSESGPTHARFPAFV